MRKVAGEKSEEKSAGNMKSFTILQKLFVECYCNWYCSFNITEQRDGHRLLLEMEETVRQLMISKFGRVIDLEALQTLSVNTTLEELKIRKLRKELLNAKEIKMWEVRMRGHVIYSGSVWVEAGNPGEL